ncbi:hypothetical protein HK405_001340, partial [Cladochytrium tenue]
ASPRRTSRPAAMLSFQPQTPPLSSSAPTTNSAEATITTTTATITGQLPSQPPRAAIIHRRATIGQDGIEFRVRGTGGEGACASVPGRNSGSASPTGRSSTSGSWSTLASASASTSSLASRSGREISRFQRAQDAEEAAFRARIVSLDRLLAERGAARSEDGRRTEAARARAHEVEEARVEAERARRTIVDEFAVIGRQLAARRQISAIVAEPQGTLPEDGESEERKEIVSALVEVEQQPVERLARRRKTLRSGNKGGRRKTSAASVR